ncbi:unnamed protein product [Mytilus coruscus]|uniref:Uncharacterized protein n=1 Tax=Mytilus coruscus TaxID=42192 RepID=A0A6J8F4I2_MYTCO|nr:unnamed protein product [Mytilus coruscus]
MSKDWENEWESDICSRQSLQTNHNYDDDHFKTGQNISDSTDNVNNMAPTYETVTAGMGMSIKTEHIKGIQRIGKMWRLYLDTEEDKLKLLGEGIDLRGKTIPTTQTIQTTKTTSEKSERRQKEIKDQQEKENQIIGSHYKRQENEQNEYIKETTNQGNQESSTTDECTDPSKQSSAILDPKQASNHKF